MGEHFLDVEGVMGSSPLALTIMLIREPYGRSEAQSLWSIPSQKIDLSDLAHTSHSGGLFCFMDLFTVSNLLDERKTRIRGEMMMKFVNRMPALLFSEFNLLTAMINLLILLINE